VPDPVTTAAGLTAACERLAAGTGPVAVDAERASGYRYGQSAYLVQLRRAGAGTILIDPLGCPDLSELDRALADTEWVIHAASQDLPCLAELGARPRTLFDTELAGRLLNYPRVGLASILERVLGMSLEKGHGSADWSTRPLPHDWLVYAALDVELLVELRDGLYAALVAADRLNWATQEFAALVAAPPAAPRTDPWRRTSGIHKIRNARALATVRSLWFTRDEIARQRDLAPGRVLPDSAIIAAALADPASAEELRALPVFSGRGNRRLLERWWHAIAEARDLPAADLPPTTPVNDAETPPPSNRWANRDPEAAARLVAARAATTGLAEHLAIPTENLVAPDAVRRLAWRPPEPLTADAVAAVLRDRAARPWQIDLTAAPLAAALDAAQHRQQQVQQS
jgi:ribonuclease D